jgi:hypothetical protein
MSRTPLYRAVSIAEYVQLMETGRFTLVGSSAEGKYFAESVEHAAEWGERLLGQGKYRIIEVILAEELANQFYRFEYLDGVGPARFAGIQQLEDVDLTIQEVVR